MRRRPGLRDGVCGLALLAALGPASPAGSETPTAGVAAESGTGAAEQAAATDSLAALDPGMPAGAVVTVASDVPFDRFPLPVAPASEQVAWLRVFEGRVVRRAYRLDDPQATTAAVAASYRDRLAALGFRVLLDCAAEACGGLAFRFGVELLPPPAMIVDAADLVQISATRELPGRGDAAVSVLVSRAFDSVYVQTVLVVPGASTLGLVRPPPPEGTAPGGTTDPRRLFEAIMEHGHVVLRGIVFASGGAELSAESEAVIAAAAEMLAAHPTLRVIVVGHSDNEGGLEANIALSRRRAEAVRAALLAHGIAAERLRAEGVGYLAPITSNASAEGRARNRRVELVLE